MSTPNCVFWFWCEIVTYIFWWQKVSNTWTLFGPAENMIAHGKAMIHTSCKSESRNLCLVVLDIEPTASKSYLPSYPNSRLSPGTVWTPLWMSTAISFWKHQFSSDHLSLASTPNCVFRFWCQKVSNWKAAFQNQKISTTNSWFWCEIVTYILNVLAPKDVHSKLMILVRDRYIYFLVSKGLKQKGNVLANCHLCGWVGVGMLAFSPELEPGASPEFVSKLSQLSPLTLRNNKISYTERQRLSTKRYSL